MAKGKNRRKERRYQPKPTPTHFIRLHRIKVIVDASRRWYVVRTESRREREVEADLRAAGFTTCLPLDVRQVARAGRAVEVYTRPAAGYVFVGFESPSCGREALWSYHDTRAADRWRERPFYRVMGPFQPHKLQRFVDRLKPPPVAVLYDGVEPVAVFPAGFSGLMDGEVAALCPVTDPLLANHYGGGYVAA